MNNNTPCYLQFKYSAFSWGNKGPACCAQG